MKTTDGGQIVWHECKLDAFSYATHAVLTVLLTTTTAAVASGGGGGGSGVVDARLKLINLRVESLRAATATATGAFTLSEISKRIVRGKMSRGVRLVAMSLTAQHAWLLHKSARDTLELRTIATTAAAAAAAGDVNDEQQRATHVINSSSVRQMRRRVRRHAAPRITHAFNAGDEHAAAADDDGHMGRDEHTDESDDGAEDEDEEEEDDDDDEDEMMRLVNDMDTPASASALHGDVKETYLRLIFEPYRFSNTAIHKSMGILSQTQQLQQQSSGDDQVRRDQLRQQLIRAIEREVQSEPAFATCTEEDFFYLNSKCWSKYYTMLKQYDFDARTPLGLLVHPHNESHVILIRKVLYIYRSALIIRPWFLSNKMSENVSFFGLVRLSDSSINCM